MAVQISKLKGFLDKVGAKYDERDDTTLVVPMSDEENRIMIIMRLMEDGEFIQMRTIKHLDDLVEEASEEKRTDLLKWMLNQNYKSKSGAWEYDPSDHDHHFAIGHVIEDSELTEMQFMRLFKIVANSLDSIPEMKKILGIEDQMSEKDKKRQALLKQLQELDEAGI